MKCKLIWPLLAATAFASGQTITNFAGNGLVGYQGDNGPATQAEFDRVVGLAADAAGNIDLADQSNHVVRKVDTSGIITTFAGVGALGFSGDTGLATHAKLNGPQGVCAAPSGVVYVTDTGNHRVRAVATNGNITTVAGNGSTASSGDNGPAISAGLNLPVRCAVDSTGNLYIVDQGASVIREVTIATGVITTIAGVNNTPGFAGDNGPAAAAQMNNPAAAIFDASGNLYVTDQANQRIRKIDTNGIITTVAGNGFEAFAGDLGDAKLASLNSPGEIAIDPLDNLFIADTSNQVIREVTAAGVISTVAGIPGHSGVGGDNGPPTAAQFNNPLGLTRDPLGNLYVGDTGNHRVRKIASLTSVPPSCTYSLNWGGQAFPAAGGNGSIDIKASPGCQWTIPNIPTWIVITGYPPNGGNGTVTYEVARNSEGERSVTLTGNGLSYTIEQEAASLPGTSFVGSMAHLAAEENWTSTFTFVNRGVVPATARLSFFGDDNAYSSDPNGNGPLTLPLTFPQAGLSAPLLATTFDRKLGSYASLIVQSAGPQGIPPVLVGSAQLVSTNTVDGFTIFHQIPSGQEAVVPMETRKATSYLLAFDNTNGLVLGVAVVNVTAQAAVIPVIVRDENGALIVTQKTSISLDGNGHFQFVLSDPANGFPETANIRGTIEFETPPNGQISVLGLRFTPPNNALTTIPAMAQVGTGGGGSIAHVASGGDGWQTTFVLVNTGSTPTSAILNFYADQTGAALTLPLAFPQSGDSSTALSVSSYTTPQLAPGATLIIVTSGAPQLLTGSAQLNTTGNISGFVIFRHNGQEAVVPLESRSALAYIIAFDNTNGTATGIAVNAVSPPGQTQPVNIRVTVRDDAGTAITGGSIPLAPNGHYAFTLGIDKYPEAANIRGTIEFDTTQVPVGVAIGALGIRIPPGTAHTYTTLPAIARQ
jgi:NHL repeat